MEPMSYLNNRKHIESGKEVSICSMEKNYSFQVRVTGILVEDNEILIVKQKITPHRSWSLPGGRVHQGELLEEAILREMREETGLQTRLNRLLYVCDKPDVTPPLIHFTFLLDHVEGKITLPTNEFDENPIHEVKMIPIENLTSFDFSERFQQIVKQGFPNSGNYVGLKSEIGL
jgi:ADP-ribose pyrophosphatase YjhB (NUDIX family)